MSLNIRVTNGSGRAKCVICNDIIEQGTLNQVEAQGYQSSARCHRSCIIDWEKIQVLNYLKDDNG